MHPTDVNIPKEMEDAPTIVKGCQRLVLQMQSGVSSGRQAARKRHGSNFSRNAGWIVAVGYESVWFKLLAHAERKIRLGSRWTRN